MPALDEWCEESVKKAEARGLLRQLREVERLDNARIRVAGKEYISFSCNDYFGLTRHPEVIRAGIDAAERYGAGAAASRLVTGNHPLYSQLEAKLAEVKRTDAALVFGSGYLANLGMISSLMGREDLIIADKLSHACMLDGAKLSGAKLLRFNHNDVADAERLLAKARAEHRHCLIMTESVFSMDGDRAPLAALKALAERYDAWLLVDDAHGFGLPAQDATQPDIWVGTLSKALGGYGGYVAASNAVIGCIKQNGRSFIFTTGLSPYNIGSSIKSINCIDDTKLNENIKYLAVALGLDGHDTPIFPVIIGEAEAAVAKQKALADKGLWVQAIRPPTVPEGTARLRITVSASHTQSDLDQLIEALKI